MYASSVVLSNQTIVTAFGYTRPPHPSGTMAVLRWRLPPKELVEAEGFFSPAPATPPTMAPPPPGMAAWPKRPLPPDPMLKTRPYGYPVCGNSSNAAGGLVCDWAIYAPLLVPWPADPLLPGCGSGFQQPALLVGRNHTLLTASGTALFESSSGGKQFTRLCSLPQGLGAVTAIGLLQDGSVLVAARTGNDTSVLRGQPNGGRCTWGKPETLGPMWAGSQLPADASMLRFLELDDEVLLTVSIAMGNGTTVAVYSSNDGQHWALRSTPGGLAPWTAGADLATTAGGQLVASVVYRRERGATGPSYLQTGFVRSQDRGRTWTQVGLVSGWLQQPASLVSLNDSLVLVFSGRRPSPGNTSETRVGHEFIVSYDEGFSWSNTIFQLARFDSGGHVPLTGGLSASSVAYTRGRVLTAFSCAGVGTDSCTASEEPGMLRLLVWTPPPRKEVEPGGFFLPPQPAKTDDDQLTRLLQRLDSLEHELAAVKQAPSTVPNNAALRALVVHTPGTAVRRLGFAAAGDSGDGNYLYQSAACGIPGGDNGGQVQPSAGAGCWVLQETYDCLTPVLWNS